MAYGVKFIGTVPVGQTLDGNLWTVEILERDNDGLSPVTIQLAAGAPTVSWGQAGDDRFVPLLVSSAEIRIFDKANTVLSAVLDADEEKYRVRIKKNTDIFWIGKLITDQIERSRDKRPRAQTFQAIDGLGTLSEIAYTGSGRQSVIQSLADLLEAVGLDLNILVALNWFTSEITDEQYPEEELRIDCGVFVNDDGSMRYCNDVLCEILERFGLQLKQSEGIWKIVQVELLATAGGYNYNVYDSSGTIITASAHVDPAIILTSDQGYQFRKVEGTGNYRRPYKNTLIEFRPLENYKEIITNGAFELWTNEYEAEDWEYSGGEHGCSKSVDHSAQKDHSLDGEKTVSVYSLGINEVGSGAGLPVHYAELTDETALLGIGNKFRFRSNAKLGPNYLNPTSGPATPRHLWFEIQVGDYYLIESGGVTAWMHKDDIGEQKYIEWKGNIAGANWGAIFDWKEYVLDSPIMGPEAYAAIKGIIRVRLYQCVDQLSLDDVGSVLWDAVSCEILPTGSEGFGVRTIAEDSVTEVTDQRDPRVFVIGDGYSTATRSTLTVIDDVTVTGSWKRGRYELYEDLTGVSIDKMLAGSWLMAQKKQSLEVNQEEYKRKGAGVGAAVEVDSVLVIGGKRYAPSEFTRDLVKGGASGEFVEVRSDDTNIVYVEEVIVEGTASGGGSGSGGGGAVTGGWSPHTHTMNQVLGLQKVLDTKATLVEGKLLIGDSTSPGVIQSSDWVSGTIGWRIGMGIAEFNGAVLNAATITGGTIQTAVSGARVEVGCGDATYVRWYDSDGTLQGQIGADTLGIGWYGTWKNSVFTHYTEMDSTKFEVYDGTHPVRLSYAATDGSIKYDGTHFQGYTGGAWHQLD